MKTTKKERDNVRSGCEFFISGYCINNFCVCMKIYKESKRNKLLKPSAQTP